MKFDVEEHNIRRKFKSLDQTCRKIACIANSFGLWYDCINTINWEVWLIRINLGILFDQCRLLSKSYNFKTVEFKDQDQNKF